MVSQQFIKLRHKQDGVWEKVSDRASALFPSCLRYKLSAGSSSRKESSLGRFNYRLPLDAVSRRHHTVTERNGSIRRAPGLIFLPFVEAVTYYHLSRTVLVVLWGFLVPPLEAPPHAAPRRFLSKSLARRINKRSKGSPKPKANAASLSRRPPGHSSIYMSVSMVTDLI